MDAAFEIFLPVEADLSQFDFKIPVFEWDSVLYPQGPPECTFGKNFKLKEQVDLDLYSKRDWPVLYQKANLKCLEILGDGLDIYVSSLYGLAEEEPEFSLKKLITILLQGKTHWIVIYSFQYDGYQSVVHSSIEEVIDKLKGTIGRAEGIMIYG